MQMQGRGWAHRRGDLDVVEAVDECCLNGGQTRDPRLDHTAIPCVEPGLHRQETLERGAVFLQYTPLWLRWRRIDTKSHLDRLKEAGGLSAAGTGQMVTLLRTRRREVP